MLKFVSGQIESVVMYKSRLKHLEVDFKASDLGRFNINYKINKLICYHLYMCYLDCNLLIFTNSRNSRVHPFRQNSLSWQTWHHLPNPKLDPTILYLTQPIGGAEQLYRVLDEVSQSVNGSPIVLGCWLSTLEPRACHLLPDSVVVYRYPAQLCQPSKALGNTLYTNVGVTLKATFDFIIKIPFHPIPVT